MHETISPFDSKVYGSQKMTKLRKEKEAEIFREFQRHQQHMSDLLQTQQQEATSDEDQRIAQAVAEQHAKRDVRHAVLLSVHISI